MGSFQQDALRCACSLAVPTVAIDHSTPLSGLDDYLEVFTPVMTNAEVIAFVSENDPLQPPGTKFDYSNSGYVVLAEALAAAAETESFGGRHQSGFRRPLADTERRGALGDGNRLFRQYLAPGKHRDYNRGGTIDVLRGHDNGDAR